MHNYNDLIKNLPSLIKQCGRTQAYVFEGMNWSRETWRRRRATRKLSISDMEKILNLLE